MSDAMTDIHYTKEVQELFVKAPKLRERIEYTAWFFPEIDRVKVGRASRSAYYDAGTGTVRLTKSCSLYVIGHELTHFLQDERHFNGKTLPKGERQCDLFLFARSPALVIDVWDTKDNSYMGRSIHTDLLRELFSKTEGQQMVYEVCKAAVEMQKQGPSHYISWAEKQINEKIMERRKPQPSLPKFFKFTK
jgi:hypothetical protein